MWAKLWISAASRPVRLRQRMVKHLADGLGADARGYAQNEQVCWAGAKHEKLRVEHNAESDSYEASLSLRGAAVAKPMSVVAEQAQLPERSHA